MTAPNNPTPEVEPITDADIDMLVRLLEAKMPPWADSPSTISALIARIRQQADAIGRLTAERDEALKLTKRMADAYERADHRADEYAKLLDHERERVAVLETALDKAERELTLRIRKGLAIDAGMPAQEITDLVDTNPAILAIRRALAGREAK